MIQPSEFKSRKLTRAGEYLELAEKRGLISADGDYLIVIKIGSSNDSYLFVGSKLAYPNETGMFFASREAAQNYIDISGGWEIDLARSGGFIAKRI